MGLGVAHLLKARCTFGSVGFMIGFCVRLVDLAEFQFSSIFFTYKYVGVTK